MPRKDRQDGATQWTVLPEDVIEGETGGNPQPGVSMPLKDDRTVPGLSKGV
jgi:hypothetical protein